MASIINSQLINYITNTILATKLSSDEQLFVVTNEKKETPAKALTRLKQYFGEPYINKIVDYYLGSRGSSFKYGSYYVDTDTKGRLLEEEEFPSVQVDTSSRFQSKPVSYGTGGQVLGTKGLTNPNVPLGAKSRHSQPLAEPPRKQEQKQELQEIESRAIRKFQKYQRNFPKSKKRDYGLQARKFQQFKETERRKAQKTDARTILV
jgi:hypothetical protein